MLRDMFKACSKSGGSKTKSGGMSSGPAMTKGQVGKGKGFSQAVKLKKGHN